jgi:transposase
MTYNRQHRFYCGVDLHARSMYVHVLDANGKTRFEQDLPAGPDAFLHALKPFRKDLALIDNYDAQRDALERHLVKSARVDDPVTFGFLRSVPGIGPILGLILLYEIDDIARFPEVGNLLSYSRLVRCAHSSAGKVKGSGPKKVGNAHLKWAFSEAACLMIRAVPAVKAWVRRQEAKKGKRKVEFPTKSRHGVKGY